MSVDTTSSILLWIILCSITNPVVMGEGFDNDDTFCLTLCLIIKEVRIASDLGVFLISVQHDREESSTQIDKLIGGTRGVRRSASVTPISELFSYTVVPRKLTPLLTKVNSVTFEFQIQHMINKVRLNARMCVAYLKEN